MEDRIIGGTLNGNANVMENTTTVSKTKRRQPQPVYSVLKKARTQFRRQVIQDSNTKRACIEKNIPAYYDDSLRFWMDLRSEANVLLDSEKFKNKCKELCLNPQNVAENVVFEGKKIKNLVRDNGLENTLGELPNAFKEPLYLDSLEIFKKPAQITDGSEKRQDTNEITVECKVNNPAK